jgi:hypothetical protein
MNGAKVVSGLMSTATGNEASRSRAGRGPWTTHVILASNMGTCYLFPRRTAHRYLRGRSFIINYKGQIVGRQEYGAGSTYVGGVIDIEAVRDHRARAQWNNWMKDLRTELYQIVYEKPIYPKNLYLKRVPMKHAEYREKVIQKQIELMHKRGIWAKPGR